MTEADNSGRLVPTATIVSPIIRSMSSGDVPRVSPMVRAMSEAPWMSMFAPVTIRASEKTHRAAAFHVCMFFFVSTGSCVPFWAILCRERLISHAV